jgi:hypothetical protein
LTLRGHFCDYRVGYSGYQKVPFSVSQAALSADNH